MIKHMRKYSIVMLIVALFASNLEAQQRMQYSQYLLNAFLINPAVGGAEPFVDIRSGYSHQWAGFKGAPKGLYLSGTKGLYEPESLETKPITSTEVTSLPTRGRGNVAPTTTVITTAPGTSPTIEPNFHLGVGGTLFSESTGPISISGLGGSFSSHIRIKDALKLSIGAGLEMLNYRLNPNNLDLVNPNDIAVADDITNLFLPSINAGFALYSGSFFVAGSTRQLLRNRIQLNPLNPVVSSLEIHYMAQAGYRFKLNDDLSLMPSVIFRYIQPAPPSMDVAVFANYKNQITGGLSYRHKDAIVGMIGLGITPTLSAQYAYDFTLSNLRNYSAGTHSIVLGLKLGSNRQTARRYFW